MAKRTREERDVIANAKLLNLDLPASKKIRKEHLGNGKQSNTSEELGALPASVANGVDIGKGPKPSKEERKEAKRIKKLLEATSTQETAEGPTVVNGIDDGADEEAKRAAAKAISKAEKATQKAEKRARRAKAETNLETDGGPTSATTSNGVEGNNAPVAKASGHKDSSPGKSGYAEDPALTALPQAEIDSFLASNFIAITDPLASSTTLRPITSFSYLPITDESQKAPFKSFSSPTSIQAAAWPFVLSGRDVVGVAETGSGKTLAFGVPCIRYITSLPKGKKSRGVKAVMVSPTRELAMQIHEQIVKLATPAGLEAVCVYGGVSKDEQRKALKTASIVVATPGRLNDLINEGHADLSNASYLVLDEADRMLDKGILASLFLDILVNNHAI